MSTGLLFVCTGNVARSVMARCMVEWLADASGVALHVGTAGTHAVEGQPAGARTQAALWTIPVLDGVPVGRHRSHQLDAAVVARSALVITMEAAHVRYVRRHHPEAAARTATLRHLCRALPEGPSPGLGARVYGLALAGAPVTDEDDVADPAGGDASTYAACAAELWDLCTTLVGRL